MTAETVHLCPPAGSLLMPCCDRTPFEVPRTDLVALDRALVTCHALSLPPESDRETAVMSEHPAPPGPPGPPTHDHSDGTRCMWVRRSGIDRWRQVDHFGADVGACPGFVKPDGEASA